MFAVSCSSTTSVLTRSSEHTNTLSLSQMTGVTARVSVLYPTVTCLPLSPLPVPLSRTRHLNASRVSGDLLLCARCTPGERKSDMQLMPVYAIRENTSRYAMRENTRLRGRRSRLPELWAQRQTPLLRKLRRCARSAANCRDEASPSLIDVDDVADVLVLVIGGVDGLRAPNVSDGDATMLCSGRQAWLPHLLRRRSETHTV